MSRTATENITVNGNKLIAALGTDNAHEILDVMEIDLANISDRDTLDDSCEWQCGVELRWWPIRGRQLNLTDEYAVRWTDTDEAGVDDVEIIERVDDASDSASLSEWLRELAVGIGSCNGNVR